MECKICELKQRQFYCEACLKVHIHHFTNQTSHFAIDRDEHINRSLRLLDGVMHPARFMRARVVDWQRRVDELREGVSRLTKENERKRDRLRTLRETIATRKRSISSAKLQSEIASPSALHSSTPSPGQSPSSNLHTLVSYFTPSHTPSPTPVRPHSIPNNVHVDTLAKDIDLLASSIARARSGLVQELVEVFNVVEVGGRPPIGGKAGTKGEWTIGDLILPVPGDMRRYPPDHINAVITHTIHFLSLLTFYLGIKLPFEAVWTGAKLGLGQPWIGAIRGGESGGWARWYQKHPLHLSSSSTPATPPASVASPSHFTSVASTLTPHKTRTSSTSHTRSSSFGSSSRPRYDSSTSSYRPTSPTSPITPLKQLPAPTDSILLSSPPSTSTTSSFTTALSMLLYDVCYLAHTQNVDVPLSQAGDVLSNLWGVCCSAELGRRSHETYPYLPPPTPPSFPLDFSQLLQATTANPTKPRRYPSLKNTSSAGREDKHTGEMILDGIDEDGWDLVDDDV